jgi:hypothetical protein
MEHKDCGFKADATVGDNVQVLAQGFFSVFAEADECMRGCSYPAAPVTSAFLPSSRPTIFVCDAMGCVPLIRVLSEKLRGIEADQRTRVQVDLLPMHHLTIEHIAPLISPYRLRGYLRHPARSGSALWGTLEPL